MFSWNNATIYFLLIDRFYDEDKCSNHCYGRNLDQEGNIREDYEKGPAVFHGGDLKGITKKLKEGYFKDLSIDAIAISPPYEQIHGFISGNVGGANEYHNSKGFPYYAYHGYWALDYSNIDANFGTKKDFKEFVDAAHRQGIRVVMDIALNNLGYATMKDTAEYDFGDFKKDWEAYYYGDLKELQGHENDVHDIYKLDSPKWAEKWWGPDFIRSSVGYEGYDIGDEDGCESSYLGLPDIKTESEKEIDIPPILVTKWKREGR